MHTVFGLVGHAETDEGYIRELIATVDVFIASISFLRNLLNVNSKARLIVFIMQ